MLLRNSISSTRKFFRKTLGTLKSLFSGGHYQKLPKSPLEKPLLSERVANCDIQQMSIKSMENSYTESDAQKANDHRSITYAEKIDSTAAKEDHIKYSCQSTSPSTKTNSENKKIKRTIDYSETARADVCPGSKKAVMVKRKEDRFSSTANNNGEELSGEEEKLLAMKKNLNNNLVEQKLKELEMLDVSNVDHVLDIEEVLHYYSRLTCPAYLEIVDKFFVEILAEFFTASTRSC